MQFFITGCDRPCRLSEIEAIRFTPNLRGCETGNEEAAASHSDMIAYIPASFTTVASRVACRYRPIVSNDVQLSATAGQSSALSGSWNDW